MAAPQELYAANSGSSSGRSWAGQPTSENVRVQGYNSAVRQNRAGAADLALKPVLFCAICNDPADFFAQRRLVCSWETTYAPRQTWIEKRDAGHCCKAVLRERAPQLALNDTPNP